MTEQKEEGDGGRVWRCIQCGETFDSVGEREYHVGYHHSIGGLPTKRDKRRQGSDLIRDMKDGKLEKKDEEEKDGSDSS